MAKRGWRSANLSPDRRIFFGQGRGDVRSRALAARVTASFGSRGGASLADLLFPLLFPPTLISVTPNSGPISGGTAVDVAGMNFRTGATVTFNGSPATGVTVLSGSHIACVTPAHAAGAVSVTVTNPDSQTSTLVGGFTYASALLVAVGGNIVATSPDGLVWTLGTIPAAAHRALAYNGIVFVALAGSGEVYTSPDGVVWTFRQDIGATPSFPGALAWNSGLGLFAATSNSVGKPISSPDGFVWAPVATAAFGGNAMGSNGTIFVAVAGGSALSSADGITWTTRTFGAVAGVGVASDGSGFVAISNTNQSRRSTDGITWVAGGVPGTSALVSIAWSPPLGIYAAVGLNVARTTVDGSSWTTQTMPAGNWQCVCWDGTKFVAVGLASIVATSPDGVTWTLWTMATGSWTGVTSQSIINP